jgi:hypothetical protein
MPLIRLEEIGFEILQPDGWESLDLEKTRETLRTSLEGTNAGLAGMGQTTIPLIFLRWPHQDPLQATPSAQVKLRARQDTGPVDPTRFLSFTLQSLHRMHWRVEVIETSDAFLLGGVPGILVHYEGAILAEDGSPIPFVSRSFSVFTNDLIYSIGLAGPPSGPYHRPEDLLAIERSIRITPD